jgi:hypothetical protein
LFVGSLGPAAQHEGREAVEGGGDRLSQIGPDNVYRQPRDVEDLTEQAGPIDIAVLNKKNSPLPHKIPLTRPGIAFKYGSPAKNAMSVARGSCLALHRNRHATFSMAAYISPDPAFTAIGRSS